MKRFAGHRLRARCFLPKSYGERVRLRVLWWEYPVRPREGDVLETSTGRLYLVVEVHGPQPSEAVRPWTLTCYVIPPNYVAPKGATVYRWSWARRARTKPPPRAFA